VPEQQPATTTAMTPDAWISSAAMKATKGTTNEIAVSSTGSVISLRSLATMTKTTKPTAAPPSEAIRNSCPTWKGLHADRHRGDGGTQRDERGGVVEQRLALEDRHDPAGQPYSPGDGRGRDGVRGRDDRADGEGHGPGDAGDQGVHDDAHARAS
jgi:hypothetical protein